MKFACILAATFVALCTAAYPVGIPVDVDVKAPWNETPLAAEAMEVFALLQNEADFWLFVDKLGASVSDAATAKDQYAAILAAAFELLPDAKRTLFPMLVASRMASPKVVSFEQLLPPSIASLDHAKRPTDAFCIINGVTATSASKLSELIDKLGSKKNALGGVIPAPFTAEMDHLYKQSDANFDIATFNAENAAPMAFLYGIPGTKSFFELHKVLKAADAAKKVTYALRYYWNPAVDATGITNTKITEEEGFSLNGYGVEYALKSVEYKVIDEPLDGADKKDAKVAEEEDVEVDPRFPLAPDNGFDTLDKNGLNNIGLAASSFIMADPKDAVFRMVQLLNNFPAYAKALTDFEVDQVLAAKIAEFQEIVAAGTTQLFLNNRPIDSSRHDYYSLLNEITNAFNLAQMIHEDNPANYEDIVTLLKLRSAEDSFQVSTITRFDIRDDNVVYLNNLEKDRAYERFPATVAGFLRPTWPGYPRYVAKNLITTIITANPGVPGDILYLANFYRFLNQKFPIRFGLKLYVPGVDMEYSECDAATAVCGEIDPPIDLVIAKSFYEIDSRASGFLSFSFFLNIVREVGTEKATLGVIEGIYESMRMRNGLRIRPFGELLADKDAYVEKIRKGNAAMREQHLTETPLSFVNGVVVGGEKSPYRVVSSAINEHTNYLIEMINARILKDSSHDLYADIMKATEQTYTTFSPYPFESSKRPLRAINFIQPQTSPITRAIHETSFFIAPKTEKEAKFVSNIFCVDLDNEYGRKLALTALNGFQETRGKEIGPLTVLRRSSRAAILPMPVGSGRSARWTALMAGAYSSRLKTSIQNQYAFVRAILEYSEKENPTIDELFAYAKKQNSKLKIDEFKNILSLGNMDWDKAFEHQEGLCSAALAEAKVEGEAPHAMIVSNGRIIPLFENDEVSVYDIAMVSSHEMERSVSINYHIDGIQYPREVTTGLDNIQKNELKSDLSMKLSSRLVCEDVNVHSIENSMRENNMNELPMGIEPTFSFGNPANSMAEFDFVVNPLTREAQRLMPLLEVFSVTLPITLRVYLNPLTANVDTLPLKVFYQPNRMPFLKFNQETGALISPRDAATKEKLYLPATRLITAGLVIPHRWLVMAKEAVYDMDNIQLDNIAATGEKKVTAIYELVNLIVEGNCHDKNLGSPPRALELELNPRVPTKKVGGKSAMSDTLVMSNYGYFQLKALPGVWDLSIRKGKSSRIYKMVDIEDEDENSPARMQLFVTSILGKTVELQVVKRPGHEDESLLVEDEEQGFARGPAKDTQGNDEEDERIHIFSVASGHLYERFVKIMMRSIQKHASVPVKFWFIENYLSPQFRESVALLSEKFGFDYEMVTYKWPAWLHPQTEKQRLIWGYKILFLDVLFPVGLKKVIYVDADQVSRTDMKELMDFDLEGAVIGMTPFCQGDTMREETKGFRFWDSGFWAEHLNGSPYHISALFVVDLQRFRQIGAGDRYRATYDSLARDPNSLANLDQDLPNYLQHNVRMKSLPQEWLWCETWCNDGSKGKAKTIDLCNNPLTKRPKLEAAQLFIEEWRDLDEEARAGEAEIRAKHAKN